MYAGPVDRRVRRTGRVPIKTLFFLYVSVVVPWQTHHHGDTVNTEASQRKPKPALPFFPKPTLYSQARQSSRE